MPPPPPVSVLKGLNSTDYSQTPLNTDTLLLRTVCFVPGEKNPLHFL